MSEVDVEALRDTVCIGDPDEAVEAAFTLVEHARSLQERVDTLEDGLEDVRGKVVVGRAIAKNRDIQGAAHSLRDIDAMLWSLLDTPEETS